MVFFTQGKTNWLYLSIVLVLSALVASGSLWFVKTQEIIPGNFVSLKVKHKPQSKPQTKPNPQPNSEEADNTSQEEPSEITIKRSDKGKVQKIAGEHLLLEFLLNGEATSDDLVLSITVKDKEDDKVIQTIKEPWYPLFDSMPVEFFDLDKNGFIDFVLKGVSVGANNAFDALYLFDPKKNKYNTWGLCNADYDPLTSEVTSSYNCGLDNDYDVYEAVDGKLVAWSEDYSNYNTGVEQSKRLVGGTWVITKDVSWEFDEGKCIHSFRELVDGQLRTLRAYIYFFDKSGNLVVERKEFDKNGKEVKSSLIDVSPKCQKAASGMILKSKDDCPALFGNYLGSSGCFFEER